MTRNKTLTRITLFTLLLLFAACSKPSVPEVPTPTTTSIPTFTGTPVPTLTETPAPTPTDTPLPTPTGTPLPTPTDTPLPTPTNTPVPTPTGTPASLPEVTYKENTILEGTVLTSEAEANRYLFQMALDGYYQFGILVSDPSMLHTESEYLELFPEILSLEIESLTKYHNGYYLRFSDLKTTQADLAYQYAIRTGDTSFLTRNEKTAYQKLLTVAEDLKLAELSDMEAILATHDYLVLNTAYDEATAASGSSGIAHYAEGTLLNGLAVCSGYASTFQLFMMLADIPCEYIWNDTHAWNLVQVEDEWYHIDVTWDDPTPDQPGSVSYVHFMMTDAEISKLKDHKTWICECGTSHDCDDESYRLYPYAEYLCTTEDEAAALILAQSNEKTVTLIYPADGSLTEDALLQLFFKTLGLTGDISYYPSEPLGTSHYLLRIQLN